MSGSNFSLSFSLLITLLVFVAPNCIKAQRSFELVKSFPAQEAFQAVAVDSRYFYAIASRSIGKYDKTTGKKILTWQEDQDGAILHLDSGVIIDGYLYAAHSNYPELPMTSSVEIWDTKTLKHTGSHSFGIRWGSCTWLDRYEGAWWAVFAHYNEFKDQLGKDNRWTTLVKFNDDWDPLQSWVFPEEVLKRFDAKSNSGGSWGSDDLLYLSGHDRPEIYAMRLPKKGSILELEEIIPVVSEGQGIAWDRSDKGVIYTISRDKREVNILKLRSE